MSTSQIGEVIDAILEGLSALPGLRDVNIFSGQVTVGEAGLECIAFGGGTLDEIAFAMGGSREETWTIGGETRVFRTWEGSTEATIKSARDRALEIFAEVETYLNDYYGSTFPDTQISTAELASNVTAEGRECRIAFEFVVKAVKNP